MHKHKTSSVALLIALFLVVIVMRQLIPVYSTADKTSNLAESVKLCAGQVSKECTIVTIFNIISWAFLAIIVILIVINLVHIKRGPPKP